MCQSRLEADRFISGTTLSANILYLFIYFLFIMAHKCKCNDLWYDDNILRVFIFYSLSTRGHSAKFRVGTNLLIQAESAEHKWVNEKVHKTTLLLFFYVWKNRKYQRIYWNIRYLNHQISVLVLNILYLLGRADTHVVHELLLLLCLQF